MTDTVQRPLRSDDLRTKRETARAYLSHGSPRVLVTVAAIVSLLRLILGQWGRGDLIVLAISLAIVGVFEWVVHLHLLHAPEDSFASRKLGTGSGHRKHHLDPHDLEYLLLATMDAVVFLVMFTMFTAGWSIPVLWVTGSNVFAGFVSAYAFAALTLAHYEWVHLLVHTKYRPKTPYYAGLTRNHRLHHYRNENYWLGVTTNSGDRLLRTLPKDKKDVPLSATARTLGE